VKQFKKILLMAGMVLLIVLACFGIGIAGGVPLPSNRRKDNSIEIRTELKETDENKNSSILYEDCL
jgi:hypothetical protein